ncbi:uncharacterized protein [Montipora capricornis]|uniref:uncharacterized protein n=1 Tax=Montipora capricornis TaxID=246305 RepID=UPI0035F1D01E
MSQRGILYERLESLDRSRRGHLSTITKVCNALDESVKDFGNVVKVRTQQIQLNTAWEQYCACCDKYDDLLDTSCEKYQSVLSDRDTQRIRVQDYNAKIERFVIDAAEFYNNQVSEEIMEKGKHSQPESVKSQKSYASRLSVSSSKAREAKVQAARAALMQQQAEERSRRVVELEVKRVQMEIKRTQLELEHRLELTKLEAAREVVAARDQAELAKLEAFLAEQEMSELTNEKDGIKWSPKVEEFHPEDKLVEPLEVPVASLPSVISSSFTPAPVSVMNPPLTSTPAVENPAATTSMHATGGICFSDPLVVPKMQLKPTVHESNVPKPVKGDCQGECQPLTFVTSVTPSTVTPSTVTPSTVTPSAVMPNMSSAALNESLTAIMSSMERISASHDLPHVRVQKFDGSPQQYPAFRQRFKQLVETKPLDDAVKMTRLLQFLEGPAFLAVQRYEPLPGGLAKALRTLEDRFGQPFQVVRASVESLTRGPVIQPNDKDSLQQYADMVQVTYDILESMGYLNEMNVGNLEKVIMRLPKWMQAKFAERLKRLEGEGHAMPTFKHVVDFLRERAFILNHPFFSAGSRENVVSKFKSRGKPPVTPKPAFFVNMTAAKGEPCPMCCQSHRLYQCEAFKSKSPRERNDFVRQHKICFNCISSSLHNSRKCKSTIRCKVEGCGQAHHTLLHFHEPKEVVDSGTVSQNNEVNQDSLADQGTSCNTSAHSVNPVVNSSEVLLQVIPVKVISNSGRQITTYGLIDSGSDITMVDPSLVKLLNIEGTLSKLSLTTVNSADVEERGMKVNFKIASLDSQNDHVIAVNPAWAVKDLTIPLKHTRLSKSLEQWPHLREVRFPEVERRKISILLGTNIQEVFVPLDVRKGNRNEPLAIKSCLGWSILGGFSNLQSHSQGQVNLISSEDVSLNDQLEEFWKIESYGTARSETKPLSVEDRRALKLIDNSISLLDGHYQMGLLWRDDNPVLPYNRPLAEARLQYLKRRFRRDPEMEVKYRDVIQDCVDKGYARKLNKQEVAAVSNITWYIPHHPVTNPNKPGKVRVVFDAAARLNGTSLNEQLLQGPCLTNDLTGVLIRFREEEVAFSADIEGMFYQTNVTPSDTDALRFLWWPGSIDDTPEDYKMLVHIFGAKSSPCCANKALSMTAQDNERKYSPEVIRTVRRNFYVDDVLKSVPKLRANPSLDLDLDQLPLERALGVYWDAQSDTFKFKASQSGKPPTKRGVLSIVSSLFDPLGFLSPFVFSAKILLQELWRDKLPWDRQIPEPYLSQWQRWLEELPRVITIGIPRCYKVQSLRNSSTVQLHNFADASRRGYAAVSYLRFADEKGVIHCSFVMGKTRNAPIREWTIPRLELQAAVLAARQSKIILRELDLPVGQTFFWSDSMTSLQYIKNVTRRFQTFVANRVAEIHETSSPGQWHHIPGVINPADDGSRGVSAQYFHAGCRWWLGPKFLWEPEHTWPNVPVEDLQDDDVEVRKSSTVMLTSYAPQFDLSLQRYSSWSRLLRVMSWVLRFVKRVRKETRQYLTSSTLKLEELQQAGREIVRLVQRQHFLEECLCLKEGRQVKRHSKLANLSPILIDDVIRVGGRIHRAPIAFEAAHPMILPRSHHVSALIVRYYHRVLGHAGREHVLSVIRQRFWILKGRVLVRQILSSCLSCRKRNAPPLQQVMADLPKERLIPYQPPFTYTGLDFFGPFYVKRSRSTVKVYGCIFVCFNSRAVHIEDVSSLETDTFIQALVRFISVRGCPKEIWSDNGTNFTGAEKELRLSVQDLNEERIKSELHSREVEWYSCPLPKWRFQRPAASHMSGVWERLIRSVRKAMRAVLGSQGALVGLETLRTVFAEVTSILNSRPICPSSDDPNDLEPLTPNHLLLQRRNLFVPPGVFAKEDLYSRKQWRHAQFIADCFWSRWIREYVPTLQQRRKWLLSKRNLAVNDLVLVVDNTVPRSRWLLGRVTRVFPGEDLCVRTAEVKTKSSRLVRPVTKLCLLEEAT